MLLGLWCLPSNPVKAEELGDVIGAQCIQQQAMLVQELGRWVVEAYLDGPRMSSNNPIHPHSGWHAQRGTGQD
jgi:hypothetical protein